MNVVISYSHKNESEVNRLERDLKGQITNLWIDRNCIKPGDIWIKEIDNALRKADYVLAVMTRDYLLSYIATWESYATLVEKLHRDVIWIPLYFEKKENLDLTPLLNAIQGIKFYENYEDGLLELVKNLIRHEKPSTDLLAEIEGLESTNPFRLVRAEYFDRNYKLIAKLFCEPEKERYDKIRGRPPVIIFGGRGSGKTMILKSLTADTAVTRTGKNSFKESGLDFFGIYLKLTRGCFTTSGESVVEQLGMNKARIVFVDDFNLKVARVIIECLQRYNNLSPPLILLDSKTERLVAEALAQEVDPRILQGEITPPNDFESLIKLIDTQLRQIEGYVGSVIMGKQQDYPGHFTSIESFLANVCKCIIEKIPDLNESKIYFLFDEFENLTPMQQEVLNTLVKLDLPYFSIKIASKFEGMYTYKTLLGQPLEDGDDYHSIEIDYDLRDDVEFATYQKLLSKIAEKLLRAELFKHASISDLLNVPIESEFSEDEIQAELLEILRKLGFGQSVSESEKSKHLKHLRTAIIFRLLHKHRKTKGKKYAGFDVFTYLSSGIIRYFLNLCGMAFYYAEDEGIDIRDGKPIPELCQTRAAYTVSEAYLEKIGKKLEHHGRVMQQFVMDLGDIFRERLLFHNSAPETLALTIKDPHNLGGVPDLRELLEKGAMESIFHKKKLSEAYRPKVRTSVRPLEYVLNRIYSPVLETSYRSRWRCEVTCLELARLIRPDSRKSQKAKLQRKQRIQAPRNSKPKQTNRPKIVDYSSG